MHPSHRHLPGLLISSAFLTIGLFTLPHYGYTWDYPHHYNAGIKRLEHLTGWDLSSLPRQDRITFGDQPYGPIADSLPVLSQIIFHHRLQLLSADSAYHLPLVLATSAGVYLLYLLTLEYGTLTASLSALFLSLYPRFVGHAHNNPKDTLSSVFLTLAIYTSYKWIIGTTTHHPKQSQLPPSQKFIRPTIFNHLHLRSWIPFSHQFTQPAAGNLSIRKSVTHAGEYTDNGQRRTPSIRRAWPIIGGEKNGIKSVRLLIISSLTTALAFNTKINAILIPPIIFLWLLTTYPRQILNHPISWIFKFAAWFILTVTLSLGIWSLFWTNPLFHIQDLIRHFSSGTTGFPIFYYGQIYQANINVPWHFALGYLAAVTPTLVLILFLIGSLKAFRDTLTRRNPLSPLLLAWFLIPTLKYMNPKVGVLDDIRHYLEVVFPLAALAAIGANLAITRLATLIRKPFIPPVSFALLTTYLIIQSYSLHPYQTSYYSEWLGGLRRVAQSNQFDVEFWGNSLKTGSQYLNQIAPPGSLIHVPMAQQVAREYLRPDLVVTQTPSPDADYLLVFNRFSMLGTRFGIYTDLYPIITGQPPLYTITRDHTPLLWIFRLKTSS